MIKQFEDVDIFLSQFLEVSNEEEIHQELSNEELAQYHPPPKEILRILRIKEIRRRETIKIFTDICLYVILLAMVMILSFQYRNPASYKMINTLRRVFINPMHNNSRVRFEQVYMLNQHMSKLYQAFTARLCCN